MVDLIQNLLIVGLGWSAIRNSKAVKLLAETLNIVSEVVRWELSR